MQVGRTHCRQHARRAVADGEQARGLRSLLSPRWHNGTGRGAGSERAGVSRSQGVLVHKAQREGDGRQRADALR